LDDETTDEMARLDIPNPGERAGVSQEVSVRVSRTPPPPPAHNPNKRGLITGQHPTPSQRVAPPPPPPSAPPKRAPAAPSRKTTGRKRSWWEVLFSDDYIRTLPKVSHSAIQKQVNFMEASLGIKRGDSLLDIGCGLGHHAHEFARRGYLVVALDLALSMITRAAEEAQQRGLRINFLHKDIRDIGFEGTFDAVICVGTTFGFFDDEQNRGVLLRLAHALKPGGRLLLDVVNRDFVISTQPNLVWFEGEGCVVMEESDFNYYSSRLHVKRTMMRDDGRQSDVEYNLRLYSVHELGQLLKQCGFVIREVSGQEATRGLFFGAQSSRIVILAERRPFTRTQSGEEGAPPSGLEH
jgi:2-polyprenyl-3-methyl-5-hydroxy-6-metoxy-1,4-benzoquinol methylase